MHPKAGMEDVMRRLGLAAMTAVCVTVTAASEKRIAWEDLP
jgi:hypothetical protein